MKTKPDSKIEMLKNFIRAPFAWPGGYPKFAIFGNGDALCRHCATKGFKRILSDMRAHFGASFEVEAVDVNWEDTELYCCDCGRPIESAYGENAQ